MEGQTTKSSTAGACRNYFVKCIEDCEAARAAKLERWHKLKKMVGDLDGVRKAPDLASYCFASDAVLGVRLTAQVLAGFIYTSVPSQKVVFRPWSSSRDVDRAQRVPTFEETRASKNLMWKERRIQQRNCAVW